MKEYKKKKKILSEIINTGTHICQPTQLIFPIFFLKSVYVKKLVKIKSCRIDYEVLTVS